MSGAAEKSICTAGVNGELMECARCGFAWPAAEAQPRPCDPIAFSHLVERMRQESSRAEISLQAVLGLGSKHGMPTDGGLESRRRLAEINAVMRLVERCAGDAAIKAILNGKK